MGEEGGGGEREGEGDGGGGGEGKEREGEEEERARREGGREIRRVKERERKRYIHEMEDWSINHST